jgi:type IV pilus assembly protein PilA
MTASSLRPQLRTALLRKLSSPTKHKQNALQKGFTLVELMIVIVIVGILSAVALPNFLNQTNKAKATEAKTISSAYLKQYHAAYLEDPSTAATDITCPSATKYFTYDCTDGDTIVATGQAGVSGTITSSVNTATGEVTMGSLEAP